MNIIYNKIVNLNFLLLLIKQKRITTGVFKWSKDYNAGVMHFDDAGK